MVVEDNDMVRVLVENILKKQGYEVLVAADAEQCLEMLGGREAKIDLLLTDVVMPGMNGRELYEEIFRKRSDIRVLFMSGYTDDVIVKQGLLDGRFGFIQKPLSVAVLCKMVRQVLDEI